MAKQEEWITITEAAKRLGLSRSTLYRWAEDGILPIYKIGKLSRIKVEVVDCLVKEAQPLYPTPEELDDI